MKRARSLFTSDAPAVWLFVGDSITQGALHTFGFRDFTQLFAERVRFELGRVRDLVLNIGVSGATSTDASGYLEESMGKITPSAAFIMLGVNDASEDRPHTAAGLKANLEKMFALLSAVGSAVVFQTSPPVLPSAVKYTGKLPSMMQAVREASLSTGAPLVDHAAFWPRYAAESPARHLEYLMSDPVHPNAYGHALLARHLLDELGIFDPASPVGRTFIP
jgi:lysophospholipase L1-like esterase